MNPPKLNYPVCRFAFAEDRPGAAVVESEKQNRRAAGFAWENGAYMNRGMKVMDSDGYVYRVLDGKKGKRVWTIWDFLWPTEPYFEILFSYEYLDQVSLPEAKEILKAQILGKNYDTERGVSRKEMAAYVDEADSFPELFKRVDGF